MVSIWRAESQNTLKEFGSSRVSVNMAPKELETVVLLWDAEERSRTVRCFSYSWWALCGELWESEETGNDILIKVKSYQGRSGCLWIKYFFAAVRPRPFEACVFARKLWPIRHRVTAEILHSTWKLAALRALTLASSDRLPGDTSRPVDASFCLSWPVLEVFLSASGCSWPCFASASLFWMR